MCKYDDDNTINNNKTMACNQVGVTRRILKKQNKQEKHKV